MSRDEILSMEAGREIDALIIDRFIEPEPPKDNLKSLREKSDDDWIYSEFYTYSRGGLWKVDIGLDVDKIFPDWEPAIEPSSDMTAAWQVVEKLDMPFYLERKDDWFAMFGDELDYSANADTAPLAICRAALLAMIGGQE
jgi:hypothetical protein